MKNYNWKAWLITGMVILMFGIMPVYGQESPTESDNADLDIEAMRETFMVEFNRVLNEQFDTRSLARNQILEEVAQSITERLGCTAESVAFDVQQETMEAGYGVYPGDIFPRVTRNALLPIVNHRPIAEMAQLFTADIFETNINQHGRYYREVGVGIAPCIGSGGSSAVGSTQQYSLFVILGSQPNAIPVVIDRGESQYEGNDLPIDVTLSVHQENSRQHSDVFGRVLAMRMAGIPLDGIPEEEYQPAYTWTLDACGKNTVYYELTDTTGKIIRGEVSVWVDCPE